MYESGNMSLTFKKKEQAEMVFPLVKEFLNNTDECEEWADELKLDGKVIEVDGDVYIPTYVYEDLVRQICKKIAESHPDYEFNTLANGADDDGFFMQNETGFLKDGKFEHIIRTTGESEEEYEDYDEDCDEDSDEKDLVTTITGKLVDGKMTFTETRKREDPIF